MVQPRPEDFLPLASAADLDTYVAMVADEEGISTAQGKYWGDLFGRTHLPLRWSG